MVHDRAVTEASNAPEIDWSTRAIDAVRKRLANARRAADRGVLIREWCRLAGGRIEVPDAELGSGVEWERFGLESAAHDGSRCVTLVPYRSADIPLGLVSELSHVLAVDVRPRRAQAPGVPDELLLRRTPYREYRNLSQKAAVRALLTAPDGSTLFVTLSTGTGKSLLFHMMARHLRETSTEDVAPTVLVLVPTVALAQDHELSASGFPGLEGSRALTGDLRAEARAELVEQFRQGAIPLLFVSPEMALGSFRPVLTECSLPSGHPDRPTAAKGRVDAVFVDEAHIVATWGRSFRPELQRIPGLVAGLRRANPKLRTTLLSATVDDDTLTQLRADYRTDEAGPRLEIAERCPRREYDFVEWRFRSRSERDSAVLRIADVLPRPALIYTTRVDHAEALAQSLRESAGFERLACFTGETEPEERRRVIRDWKADRLDLVVATSAFGLGVDKQDVRAVVHACLPEGGSRYYQEIGRAGRDGYQAFAIALAAPEDERLAVQLAVGTTLTLDTARPRWHGLLREARIQPTPDWITGRPLHAVNLGARGLQLQNQHAGQRNRQWSKSLLVQLQRYGAIEVASTDEDGDEWTFTVRPGWESLVEPALCDEVLARLFQARDAEERAALEAVRAFAGLWSDRERCRLQALFAMVEAGTPDIPPCGHCRPCRSAGESGQWTSVARGTSRTWDGRCTPAAPRVLHVTGAQLVEPRDVARFLSEASVQQVIAPARIASAVAEACLAVHRGPAWITAWEEVLRSPEPLAPLQVPTAVVLERENGPETDEHWYYAMHWRERSGCVAWWVARPGTRVDGRFLDDVGTSRPPLDLDAWLRREVA